jgi:hypothetical protein
MQNPGLPQTANLRPTFIQKYLGILANFADYSGYADFAGCAQRCAPSPNPHLASRLSCDCDRQLVD